MHICRDVELKVNQIWRRRNGTHGLIHAVGQHGVTVVDCNEDGVVLVTADHRSYYNFGNLCAFYNAQGEGIDGLDLVMFIGIKKEEAVQSNIVSMDKKYKTRDGRNVRVLCIDRNSKQYPVLVLVEEGNEEISHLLTAEGHYFRHDQPSRNDLIEVQPFVFIPEVGRKYKSRNGAVWTILLTNCGDDVYSVVAYKEESGINQIGYFTVKGECWQDEENNDDMIAYAD